MNAASHLFPKTQCSVLVAAGLGQWDRFWGMYLKPCLRELSLELKRVGLRRTEPEELLDQLFWAIAKPGGLDAKHRSGLRERGRDTDLVANVPAKFMHLLEALAADGGNGPARFRTLLRAIIRRVVLGELRKLIAEQNRSTKARAELAMRRTARFCRLPNDIDDWADRLWIVQLLRGTCAEFFSRCERSRTRSPRRYPRLLFYSLVQQRTPSEIAKRERMDASWVSRQLKAAEARFAAAIDTQYAPEDKPEVQRLLADQNTGLVAAVYQEAYQEKFGLPESAI